MEHLPLVSWDEGPFSLLSQSEVGGQALMLHWTLLLSELITGISSFLGCAKTLAQRRRCPSTGQITAALSMFAEVRDERQGQISLAY